MKFYKGDKCYDKNETGRSGRENQATLTDLVRVRPLYQGRLNKDLSVKKQLTIHRCAGDHPRQRGQAVEDAQERRSLIRWRKAKDCVAIAQRATE
jgi:hypothetical protein